MEKMPSRKKYISDIEKKIYAAFVSQDPKLFDVVFEIEGEKLYAEKLRLSVASPTFESMLSDRWNSTNEPVKITGYKFENFKEMLHCVYSGKCKITDSNVYDLLDMSEFYQIHQLKDICDQFLTKMKINLADIFQLIEISARYSLNYLNRLLTFYTSYKFEDIVNSDEFMIADKTVIEEIIRFKLFQIKPDKIFKVVFKWSEYQAMKKQDLLNVENYDKNDAIKAELISFLPHIKFNKTSFAFVQEYTAKQGFTFPEEVLDEIMKNIVPEFKVTITNASGKSISCQLSLDPVTVDVIKSINNVTSDHYTDTQIWWKPVRKIGPLIRYPFKKTAGIEWYLIYFFDGDIGVRHTSRINKTDYIIAEMDVVDDGYCLTKCKIEIV